MKILFPSNIFANGFIIVENPWWINYYAGCLQNHDFKSSIHSTFTIWNISVKRVPFPFFFFIITMDYWVLKNSLWWIHYSHHYFDAQTVQNLTVGSPWSWILGSILLACTHHFLPLWCNKLVHTHLILSVSRHGNKYFLRSPKFI